ncbi:MAG: hypothetical protein GPJ54_10575 [Candidatus Heimdallarchaeota archaeon]|nr:hypothetical protein [Candidatus Heimdallarchaeota archaeon]
MSNSEVDLKSILEKNQDLIKVSEQEFTNDRNHLSRGAEDRISKTGDK